MRRLSRGVLALTALLCSLHLVRALAAAEPSLAVPVLQKAPALNGTIDASWSAAAKLTLAWDSHYQRAAAEKTTVYVAQFRRALYVAFDVRQHEAITATQHTNGPGVAADDMVGVYLNPQGTQGFNYSFESNPIGARYQSSSENSAYSPQWSAVGKIGHGGYVVTMRIPLRIIRSGGSHVWRAQFVRAVVATNENDVWTYNPAEQWFADPNYMGKLTGIVTGAAVRPPARVQIYGLDELAAASAGGSTSRLGADIALPISATTSFLATLHPDYSNVEIDQQSISPQEFTRFYQEVRPFFTQAASPFNGHFGCLDCPQTLYTPAIPTFSQGYAVEGAQGPATFAAFDAFDAARSDSAEVVNFTSMSRQYVRQLSLQNVDVNYGGVHDQTSTLAAGYGFSHGHTGVWYNAGTDRGTFVTDPSQAGYSEFGVSLGDSTSGFALDHTQIGAQFLPLDGYVAHADVDGWLLFTHKHFRFSPKAFVQQVGIHTSYDFFHDHTGRLDQSDQNLNVSADFRALLSVNASVGSSYLLLADGSFVPFNQNGLGVTYRGNTATPSMIFYNVGRYYHGSLTSWTRLATLPLAARMTVTFEADDDRYVPDPGTAPNTTAVQWLERASLDWQLSRDASFDLGVRRITGLGAPTGFGPVPTVASSDTNLTAAFHFLALRNEFYAVYGDPNTLDTTPALFLKWIRYIGAPKGT